MSVLPLFLLYPCLSYLAAFSLAARCPLNWAFFSSYIYRKHEMLISFMSLKFKIWFQKCFQTKRGELKVMLTHGDWHVFTLLILECREVMKIYRDHPYGLKPYHIILLYHFILHNICLLSTF